MFKTITRKGLRSERVDICEWQKKIVKDNFPATIEINPENAAKAYKLKLDIWFVDQLIFKTPEEIKEYRDGYLKISKKYANSYKSDETFRAYDRLIVRLVKKFYKKEDTE